MEKSREAFRTISEVADWLDVPTHVLRFWESRFTQVKPVKRAGGRRYYRPSDMELIGGIKTLLHDDGMTIRGVQKLLREEGVKHVSGFSKPIFDGEADTKGEVLEGEVVATDDAPLRLEPTDQVPETEPAAETSSVRELDYEMEEAETQQSEEPATTAAEAPPLPGFGSVRRKPEAEAQEPVPAPAEATEPEPQEALSIPATPQVSETDPEDDDPGFDAPPGVAARIFLGEIIEHPAEARKAKATLIALRDRLNQSAA